ncbi:hypothetical protein [Burkholderia sp. BCC0405]|uniref:hypothetical protein n=1 Tax=Burkholderia sp. BCC0405 TaxID=2676298 RepID=UPI00158E040C|nr:hypothetical protein [Burkholderia sp. BCC0405]
MATSPKQQGRSTLTIEHMHAIATARGGRCLSSDDVNAATPLLFECAADHRWSTAPANIRGGRWYRQCFCERVRDTIGDMRALAASRGGERLSTSYDNQFQRLRWRCASGHEWESPAISAKKHWCQRCFRERRRLGIHKMREIAAERGGTAFPLSTSRHSIFWSGNVGWDTSGQQNPWSYCGATGVLNVPIWRVAPVFKPAENIYWTGHFPHRRMRCGTSRWSARKVCGNFPQ